MWVDGVRCTIKDECATDADLLYYYIETKSKSNRFHIGLFNFQFYLLYPYRKVQVANVSCYSFSEYEKGINTLSLLKKPARVILLDICLCFW